MEPESPPGELMVGEVGGLGPVRLRRWRDEDAATLLPAFGDPEILHWMTQAAVADLGMVRRWLDTRHEGWADGSAASWAVTGVSGGGASGGAASGGAASGGAAARVLPAAEILLGSAGLRRLNLARLQPPRFHSNVSYWTVPAARGHGLASTVAAFLARWAWSELRLHRVELHHETANVASCRVAQRAGYALEGTLRRSFLSREGWVDEHLHAFLSDHQNAPGQHLDVGHECRPGAARRSGSA